MTLYRVIGRDTGIPSLNDSALAGAAFGAIVDLTLTAGVEAELIDAGLIELAVPDTAQSGIELNIRDYPGLDAGGTTDMRTLINTASAVASAAATAGSYPYVRLVGFGRGVYRVDNPLWIRDKVRFELDEARIVAGADFSGAGQTSGIFRASETLNSAVAQGTGTTANTSYVITGVSLPLPWKREDRITGTGIPANTKVIAVDVLNSRLVLDAAATASGTVTLTKAATYYGNYRKAGIIGGELDPNGKAVGAIIRALWTEDFTIDGTRLLHNRGSTAADWATAIGGNNMRVDNLQVVGGHRVFEDGFHFCHGQHLRASNLDIECGDDAIVFGYESTDAGFASLPDPIRDAVISGAAVRTHRGFAPKIYIPAGGAGRDWEITDIEIHGVVGEAGVLRNGGIWIEDLNHPAAGTALIKRININGVSLALGGRGHDDVQGIAVYVRSASDVKLSNARLTVAEGEAASGGFDLARITDSEDVILDNIACPLLGRRFACDVVTSNRVRLKNSVLTQNQVSPFSNFPIRLNSCVVFEALDNEFIGLRAGQPMMQCTTGTGTRATFRGNAPRVIPGGTTAYGFNVAAACIDQLIVENNDFSRLTDDISDPSTLAAIPSYCFRNNIGTPDRMSLPSLVAPAAILPQTLRDDYDLAILYGTGANARLVKGTDYGRTWLRIINTAAVPVQVGFSALETIASPGGFVALAVGEEFLTNDKLPYWAYAPITGGASAGDEAGFVRVQVEQSA